MPEQIENRMVVDSEWGEIEYGVPYDANLKKEDGEEEWVRCMN